MHSNIEAIKEAVSFIQSNWIGKTGMWRGDIIDFAGAVIHGNVTQFEIQHLIRAISKGEPTPIEGLGGTVENNKITSVWVTKCMD